MEDDVRSVPSLVPSASSQDAIAFEGRPAVRWLAGGVEDLQVLELNGALQASALNEERLKARLAAADLRATEAQSLLVAEQRRAAGLEQKAVRGPPAAASEVCPHIVGR